MTYRATCDGRRVQRRSRLTRAAWRLSKTFARGPLTPERIEARLEMTRALVAIAEAGAVSARVWNRRR